MLPEPGCLPIPTVAALMSDPSVSRPLLHVLSSWLMRDPIDAARDATLLAAVLGRRADDILASPS